MIGQEISELWGVEFRHFALTRLIAYTTACCYRTSRDPRPRIAYTLYNFQGAAVIIKGSLLMGLPL